MKKKSCGSVKWSKHADPDKYSVYGVSFDVCGTYLFVNAGFGNNVIIFGVYISSPVHFDNKKT